MPDQAGRFRALPGMTSKQLAEFPQNFRSVYHRHMAKRPCVYILTNRKHGTLYVGVTSNLAARLLQHRSGDGSDFTSEHGLTRLVHVEFLPAMEDAIAREKQLKHWNRAWKIQLIERGNPDWRDLFEDLNA